MEPMDDGVICVVQDQTDRVDANRQSLKRAARFRAIVEGSSELVVVTDGTGAMTFVSPEPVRRLGYEADELIGRNAFDLIHPDEAPDAIEALAGSLSGPGVKDTSEVRIRTADGGWRLFEVVPTNMLDDPDVEGLVFHLRDLTERYEQQRAFRFMFEYSPLPQIQSFPGSGLAANHAFASLTGYSREELLAMRLRDLVHPDDALGLEAMRDQLLGGEPALEGLHRFVRKNESVFYGRVQATAVRDDTGSLSYFLGVFEDVTAEIEATSALKASEARLRAIIDNSPDIIAVLYPSGHWEASRQSTRLLGYPNGYVVDGGLYALDPSGRRADGRGRPERGARRHPKPEGTDRAPPPGVRRQLLDLRVRRPEPGLGRRRRWCRRHGSQRHRTQAGGTRAPRGRRAVPYRVRALAVVRVARRSRRPHPRHQRGGRRAAAADARGTDRDRCARLCAPGRRRARDRSDVAADLRHRRDRGVPHGARRRDRSLGDVARRTLHAGGRSGSVRHLAPDRHHRAAQPRGASRQGSHHGSAHGVAEPQRVHEPRAVGVGAHQQGGGRAAVPRPRPVQGRERHVRARRRRRGADPCRTSAGAGHAFGRRRRPPGRRRVRGPVRGRRHARRSRRWAHAWSTRCASRSRSRTASSRSV